MPDLIGASLGPYRIIEQIGRGGMATVYKAYHPATERDVAIKVLPEQLAEDPSFLARFEREAKVVAGLQHVHILPVFDYGQERSVTYLVMPYIPTGTLKDYLLAARPTLDDVTRIFCQIADAVDYAHRKGVIHRDLKPGNVLLDDSENALLSDFGLTRMAEGTSALTGTGVIGTPAYMSPEQGQGLTVDARSDIYSLGIILYEMVTGEVPFSADTPVAVIFKHISQPLPLPRQKRPDIPEVVEKVILRALDKDPENRFQTAGEMAQALRSATAGINADANATRTPAPTGRAWADTEAPLHTQDRVYDEAPTAIAPAAEKTVAQRQASRLPLPPWAIAGLVIVAAVVLGLVALSGGQPVETTPTSPPADVGEAEGEEPSDGDLIALTELEEPWGITNAYPCHNAAMDESGLCLQDSLGRVTRILEDSDLNLESAEPSWDPWGERLVFAAWEDEALTLHIVNADGSSLAPLNVSGGGNTPAWSPDGQWIAFNNGGRLSLVRPDGSDKHTIWYGWDAQADACISHPQWSQDGSYIVVSLMTPCSNELPIRRDMVLVSVDGESAELVRSFTHETDWSQLPNACPPEAAAFSPDGLLLAYFDEMCDPWIIRADGVGEPQAIPEFPWWWTGSHSPQWNREIAASEE